MTIVAAIAIAFTGCDKIKGEDDPEPSLDVTPANILAAAGSYAITVTCNTEWTAGVVGNDGWGCYLSQYSGDGSSTVTVDVEENRYFEPRTATITFTAGSLTREVAVVQAAAEMIFTVDKNSLIFDGAGGGEMLEITYNTYWTATLDDDAAEWCTVSPSSGDDMPAPMLMRGTVWVFVEENTPDASRSGTLTFTAGTLTRKTLITQPAAIPYLELFVTSLEAVSIESSYDVAVTGNVPWTVAVNSEATEWCSVSPIAATGADTVTITVTENPANDPRAATVTFTSDAIVRTLTVTQSGTPPTPAYAASTMTWVFGRSVWSDAIQRPECHQETFAHSRTDPQCRSFSWGWTFYYYNWAYVQQRQNDLCPSPWRVPTAEDLIYLHGVISDASSLRPMLGEYGGYIDAETNSIKFHRYEANLWSSTQSEDYWAFEEEEDAANTAVQLMYYIDSGRHYDSVGSYDKVHGMQVRCVR